MGKNKEHLTNLTEFLEPVAQSGHHWELCWRASVNGWASTQFHKLCDGQGPTVTIIKVNKYIFGGYTSVSWDGKQFHFVYLKRVSSVKHAYIKTMSLPKVETSVL